MSVNSDEIKAALKISRTADFYLSALRDELKSKGYVIEDTPAGMKVKKI